VHQCAECVEGRGQTASERSANGTLSLLQATSSVRSSNGVRYVVVGLVAIAVGVLAWILTPEIPRLDDGFISLESAQSLIAGRDSHYGSPPLAGVTSPPYVLLIVGLLKTGLDPLMALRVVTAMGLAALVGALWLLARAVKVAWWSQMILPAVILIAGPVAQQATNGVETGWAMAVAVGLIAATVARRQLWCAVAAGCLPWLRPDLAPMAGLLFVWTMWRSSRRTVLIAVALSVCVFGSWALWLHHDTGLWIPQSMAVKAAFVPEWCQSISTKLGTARNALSAWLVMFFPISILAAISLFATPVGRVGMVATIFSLCAYVATLPGALWFNAQRYLYALFVPWLSFGIATVMRSSHPD